jgi:hypothetical protein
VEALLKLLVRTESVQLVVVVVEALVLAALVL